MENKAASKNLWGRALKKLVKVYWRSLKGSEPKTKFIIFGQGRTGSTLLINILNCSPDIYCDGEVFGVGMPINIPFRNHYLKSRSRAANGKAYGCRIKIYDLYQTQKLSKLGSKEFIRALNRDGWKIIYLYRTNKLRQALSTLVADASNIYHASKEAQPTKHTISASLLPKRIHGLLEYDKEEQETLEGIDHLRLSYEHDLLDQSMHQNVLNQICDYLNVAPAQVSINLKRTSDNNLTKYLENYDEVHKVISENDLSHYLENEIKE